MAFVESGQVFEGGLTITDRDAIHRLQNMRALA